MTHEPSPEIKLTLSSCVWLLGPHNITNYLAQNLSPPINKTFEQEHCLSYYSTLMTLLINLIFSLPKITLLNFLFYLLKLHILLSFSVSIDVIYSIGNKIHIHFKYFIYPLNLWNLPASVPMLYYPILLKMLFIPN